MRSFLWRLKSNTPTFIAVCILFTAAYAVAFFSSLAVMEYGFTQEGSLYGILHAVIGPYFTPVKTAGASAAIFFFFYAKTYTPYEAYLYGFSRRQNRRVSLAAAVVYAGLFAMYAVAVAAVTRMLYFSVRWAEPDIYRLPADEYFLNFAVIFMFGLLSYAAANSLRCFRSARFWVGETACVLLWILLFLFTEKALPGQPLFGRIWSWDRLWYMFLPVTVAYGLFNVVMTIGRQKR